VRLACADTGSGRAGYRPWHGRIAQAMQLGADGGWARYRLVLRPWTHLLTLRRDAFVFQDMTVLEMLSALFQDCPAAQYRFDVSIGTAAPLRPHSLCVQHNETDWAFACRLMAEEGLSYHFEHPADAGPLMVITERRSRRSELGTVRFTRPDVNGVAEAIDSFAEARQLQPNAVTRASWDYRQLVGRAAEQDSGLAQGEIARLEDYDGSGAYRYADAGHAEHAAALRLARHELGMQHFEGSGSSALLRAGGNFTLVDHPLYGAGSARDNHFTLTEVEHLAVNNLGQQITGLLQCPTLTPGTYRSRFVAVPAAAAVVPAFEPRPTVAGRQTALVTGLANEPLTTDRDLRVKLQFPWQRGTHPLPGGLPHDTPHDHEGNAPGDLASGTWVRVLQPAAGANWGSAFVPRRDTEVLVDWVEGDIDRPVVVAQLHNGVDALPWPAGSEVGSNHPGVLAGWHADSLDRAGFNQWVIDDATGQCRMRLASQSSASPWSELSLGHLINQGARSAQRGAWLGSGFYGHSDGWLTLNAAEGLLLSTTARPGSYGSAQGVVMQVPEAVAQLQGAQQLGQAVGTAAQAQGALGLSSHAADPQQALAALLQATDPSLDGKYDDPDGLLRKAVDRTPGDPVERFAQPHLLLDTPSTAAFATPAAIAVFTGQDFSLTAQADLHTTAAHAASLVSGQATSLYTHAGELQAITANGPLSLRAHTDTLHLLADREITVVSVNDEIHLQASTAIELIGGNSKLSLAGEHIDFVCPGVFTVKSSTHAWQGPRRGEVAFPNLPGPEKADHWLELNYRDVAALPMAHAPYTLRFADGTTLRGALDAQGHARVEGVPYQPYTIEYGEDPSEARPRHVRDPNPFFGQRPPASQEAAVQRLQAFCDQDQAYLEDNFFPDEISAMQALGEGSVQAEVERYSEDYLLDNEDHEAQAQSGYAADHPEGVA